jgi:hypothetical protein
METATTTTAGTTPLTQHGTSYRTGSECPGRRDQMSTITDAQTEKLLQHEIKGLRGSKRFTDKVNEVQGLKVARHHEAIDKYLKRKYCSQVGPSSSWVVPPV